MNAAQAKPEKLPHVCHGTQCRGEGRWGTAVKHTCPFALDIYEDDRLCNCCKECERQCADEV